MFLWAQQNDPAFNSGYIVGKIFGALIIGLLFGLLIQKFGQKRGHKTLSWVAFAITLLAGLIAGLIGAVPIAGLFALIFACWNVTPAPERGPRRSGPSERFPTRTPDQPYDL